MSLVSTIVPAYNRAWCIADTLEPLCGISADYLLEILVLDNGSTDETREVVERLSKKDPRIRYVDCSEHPRNGNVMRNIGFSRSRGKYIQFLDSDDVILPGKVEAQVDLLENGPGDSISLCRWGCFSESVDDLREVPRRSFWRDYDHGIDLLLDLWLEVGWFYPGCWLVPRELCSRVGLWNESLAADQDGEYLSRILGVCGGVRFLDRVGFAYRSHAGERVTTNRSPESVSSRFRSWEIGGGVLDSRPDSAEVATAKSRRLRYLAYVYGTRDNGWLAWCASRDPGKGRLDASMPCPRGLGWFVFVFGFEQGVRLRRAFASLMRRARGADRRGPGGGAAPG